MYSQETMDHHVVGMGGGGGGGCGGGGGGGGGVGGGSGGINDPMIVRRMTPV